MDNELLAQRYERIRHKVIRQANQLFRAQGIRDVTMDDISKSLRISKRTLYQLFNGKEGLVLACVKQGVANDGARRAEIERHTDDALEILSASRSSNSTICKVSIRIIRANCAPSPRLSPSKRRCAKSFSTACAPFCKLVAHKARFVPTCISNKPPMG